MDWRFQIPNREYFILLAQADFLAESSEEESRILKCEIRFGFLFRGDETLKIQLAFQWQHVLLDLKPVEPRRKIIQIQCWRAWWREYNKAFQNNEDYPLAFEVYLTSMLAERLDLTPTVRSAQKAKPESACNRPLT